MFKKMLFGIALLLFMAVSSQVFAQRILGEETGGGLRVDIIAAPVRFSSGGEVQLLETPSVVGVVFDYSLFGLSLSSGFYSAISINTLEANDVKLGGIFHTKVWRGLGFGLFYDWWMQGEGFVKPTKADNNWGFVGGIDFSLGTKSKKEGAQTFGSLEIEEVESKETGFRK